MSNDYQQHLIFDSIGSVLRRLTGTTLANTEDNLFVLVFDEVLNIKPLVITNAHKLENSEFNLNSPVDCHDSLPVLLSQSSPFFSHGTMVKKVLSELKEGRTERLPSLLLALSVASYRNQVSHSLSALKELCDIGISAELIWKTRTELLLNNLRIYEAEIYHELDKPTKHVPWCWTLANDFYQASLLADLMIWDYCQKTVADAQDYIGVMKNDEKNIDSLPVFLHCLTNKKTPNSLYRLATELLFNFSCYTPEAKPMRDIFNNEASKNLLLYAIHTAPDTSTRADLIESLMNLLKHDSFMDIVPTLRALEPTIVRTKLIRISNAESGWYNGFFNQKPIGYEERLSAISNVRNKILMLALCPAKYE